MCPQTTILSNWPSRYIANDMVVWWDEVVISFFYLLCIKNHNLNCSISICYSISCVWGYVFSSFRRGIGWHLLKASEELISHMSPSREVYLHCRMIDAAPLKMYEKAGYSIIKTDSILILLMLQRRKHLMCKKLPALRIPSDVSHPDEELKSWRDLWITKYIPQVHALTAMCYPSTKEPAFLCPTFTNLFSLPPTDTGIWVGYSHYVFPFSACY